MRTLTLAKGGRTYLFRYEPGCERQMLDEISRLAEDERTGLDWLDAAALSFQIAHHTADDCYKAMSPLESAEG